MTLSPAVFPTLGPGAAVRLTARQRKFLTLAADEYGFDPWDPPAGAPVLRNEEIRPLIEAGLVAGSNELDIWVTTPKGRAALNAAPTSRAPQPRMSGGAG